MSSTKIKLCKEGVREILKSDGVQAMVLDECLRVANKAGDGFEASVQAGRNRAQGMVRAESAEAHFRNLKENILIKSL